MYRNTVIGTWRERVWNSIKDDYKTAEIVAAGVLNLGTKIQVGKHILK